MLLTLKEILGACKSKPGFVISVFILLTFGLGCLSSDNKPSETIQNTVTPKPTITASKPTPTPYDSGGLGLNKDDWDKTFGTGKPDNPSKPDYYAYDTGNLVIQFNNFNSGNVQYIERIWGDKNAVPISEARQESKRYIPKDSKFLKTYTSSSGSTIELYSSQSLITQFEADQFIGGKPGDFIILYRNQTGKVTTFIVALGNNP